MQIPARFKYESQSDKELVDAIIRIPPDEGAAMYLLYEKYNPFIRKLYIGVFHNMLWYDDCMNDLFAYLKGKNQDWGTFRTFEWRSKFTTWLGQVARNRFLVVKPYMMGKIEKPISIDDENGQNPVTLSDESQEDYERRQRKVLLMEAVGQLKDMDQKFVILKTLQGYNSAEIADLLNQKWQKDGIKKYDNKGQLVVPSPGYIDVRRQRAKEQLKRIIVEL